MAKFPEHFIQQVLQATNIVDLIGRYVALKPKGREFVGLCPFHDDHKPSMFVSPVKQIFKCFACQAGGNALQFMMNYEKTTFPEAVRALAEQANIPLPTDYAPAPADGLSRNDLIAAVEFAAKFFHDQLQSSAGAEALAYARSRGLSDESIETYQLGFAPDSWDSLFHAARRAGFSEQRLVAAGLIRRRDSGGGCYDYFRNRLIFPIHDAAGRVVAFGGRAMSAGERAKYLNSPESALFDKSSLVYGLPFAREAIVQSRQAVVAEGYLDVVIPHQFGVHTVVATLGTALTERHARLLGRYAEQIVLLFDADAAGTAAAERALQLFLAQKLHVRVATIPEGKDPCDFALAAGGEALQALIDQAPDALQYVWDRRYAAWQAAGGNPSQQKNVIDDFLTLVVNSAAWGAIDQTRQQNLAQHIAHILNLSAMDLQQQLKRLARQARGPTGSAAAPAATDAGTLGASGGGGPERLILEVLLDRPDLFDTAAEKIDPHNFHDAMLRTIAERIWAMGAEGAFNPEDLLAAEEMVSLAPVLTEMMLAGQRRGNSERTLADAITAILDRAEKAELHSLKQGDLDDEKLRRLHEKLVENQNKSDATRRPRIEG